LVSILLISLCFSYCALVHPDIAIILIPHDDFDEGWRIKDRLRSIIPRCKLYLGIEDYSIPDQKVDDEWIKTTIGPYDHFQPFKKIYFLSESLKLEALQPLLEVFKDETRHLEVRSAALNGITTISSATYYKDRKMFETHVIPLVIPEIRAYVEKIKGHLYANDMNRNCFDLLYFFDPDRNYVADLIEEEIDKSNNADILLLHTSANPYTRGIRPSEEIMKVLIKYLSSPNAQYRYNAAITVHIYGDKKLALDVMKDIAISHETDCTLRARAENYIYLSASIPENELKEVRHLFMKDCSSRRTE